MHTIYATVLTLEPHPAETVSDCYNRLVEGMRNWVERALLGWGIEATVAFGGPPMVPRHDHWLRSVRTDGDDYAIASIDWWHPGRPDVNERWQTLCTLARHRDELELSISVEVPTVEEWINPALYSNVRPGLLDAMLAVSQCSVAGWLVTKRPPIEGQDAVVRYLTGTLLNPNRKIPAILISGQLSDDTPIVDTEEFRQTLTGLADVAVLKDKDAGYKLTQAMGNKMLSCFDGAVRVYWPRFRLEDDPYAHNLWLREHIQREEDNGQALLRHLIQQMTDYTLEHRPARVSQAVRAIVTPTRQTCEENAESVMPTVVLPMAKSRFRSVEDVVHQAKTRFRETMIFLDSAFSSAHASNYGQPDDVWKLFEALHTVAQQWQTDERLRMGWYQTLRLLGYQYKDAVSMTSLGKHGDEYKFLYAGEKHLFDHHITLGAGRQRTHCMSLHWYRDDERFKLVIGHCGPHLTNTRT